MEKWKKYVKKSRHSKHDKHDRKDRNHYRKEDCNLVKVIFVFSDGSKSEKLTK